MIEATYRGRPVHIYPPCRRTIKIDLADYLPNTRVPREIIRTLTFNLPFPQQAFFFAGISHGMEPVFGPHLFSYFIHPSGDAIPSLLPNISEGRVCLGKRMLDKLDDAVSLFWQTHFYESSIAPWQGTHIVSSYFLDHKPLTLDRIVETYRCWSEASPDELNQLLDVGRGFDPFYVLGTIRNFQGLLR